MGGFDKGRIVWRVFAGVAVGQLLFGGDSAFSLLVAFGTGGVVGGIVVWAAVRRPKLTVAPPDRPAPPRKRRESRIVARMTDLAVVGVRRRRRASRGPLRQRGRALVAGVRARWRP
ncbi:hypothetical protein Val02_00270 [Virgisporangium aliadipatigenens]|uniref:Uncharacterized protein n=1 Tax=Virgisporangium aliadipatigenens TaxID=741659 RepID=A0A8J3YDT9_9ACTN|nr:hypothetical protein [Virgisporangium aliadipatigenens]GIJ43141.1 hypothetical protein Val02_00270 [Virgisporangium aliadipatigenens]